MGPPSSRRPQLLRAKSARPIIRLSAPILVVTKLGGQIFIPVLFCRLGCPVPTRENLVRRPCAGRRKQPSVLYYPCSGTFSYVCHNHYDIVATPICQPYSSQNSKIFFGCSGKHRVLYGYANTPSAEIRVSLSRPLSDTKRYCFCSFRAA